LAGEIIMFGNIRYPPFSFNFQHYFSISLRLGFSHLLGIIAHFAPVNTLYFTLNLFYISKTLFISLQLCYTLALLVSNKIMKKIILLAVMFLVALPAFADVLKPSNGNPQLVSQVWGLNGLSTPVVSKGSVISDEAGFKTICIEIQGCFDLTKTSWYRNSMKSLAQTLKTNGFIVQFPQFAYWLNAI